MKYRPKPPQLEGATCCNGAGCEALVEADPRLPESGPVRPLLTVLSVVAVVAGLAAIAVSWATHAPQLAFRIVASVLLIDQASMTLLCLRLPVDMRPLRIALRIGAVFAIAAGALVIVWSALPHEGPVEIAMPVVGGLMIAHAVLTLRWLTSAPAPETA